MLVLVHFKKILSLLTGLVLTGLVFGWQPVLTFSVGGSNMELAPSQTFAPLDLCYYSYKPNQQHSTSLLWGGFAGIEFWHAKQWLLVSGIAYYQPNDIYISGDLTQGADSLSANTYRYQYQIQNRQLLLESRLYMTLLEKMRPFLMFGLGGSYNQLSDFQTTVPAFLAFTPNFYNQSQIGFSYAVGPGLELMITKGLALGFAWRFTDLAAIKTTHAQIDNIPLSIALGQSHSYTNQLLLQLTVRP